MRFVVLLVVCGSVVACQQSPDSSSPGQADADPPIGVEATLTFGPVAVPPGVERTQCVTRRLGNPAQLRVGSIHNQLRGASHHLIIYRVDDDQERLEPYDCEPFADTLNARNGAPLMITQKHEELLELPDGLAFVLEPDQMIRLEVHYINASAQEATIEAVSTFRPLTDSQFRHAVGFLFAGDVDIALQPGQPHTQTAFLEVPIELYEKQFFGFTGHTHKLGTDVVVEMGERSGPMEPVYQVPDFSWSEPPTVFREPAITLPDDGRFRIRCEYVNTTDKVVRFGESANDEMCFFWGYYFPSAGSHVCFHTNRGGLDINTCCPGGAFCR